MDNGHWGSFGWTSPKSDETGVWETASEKEYDELSEPEDSNTPK